MSPMQSDSPQLAQIRDLLLNGETEQAEPLLADFLQEDPTGVDAVIQLARLRREKGDLAAAKVVVATALAVAPKDVPALNLLGLVLTDQGAFPEAEQIFGDVLTIRPDYVPTLTNLAALLQKRARIDESAGLFQQALELQPDNVYAMFNLATLRAIQCRVGEAYHLFLTAHRLKPDEGFAVCAALLLPQIPRSAAELAARRARMAADIDHLETLGTRVSDLVRMATVPFLTAYHGVNVRDLQTHIATFFARSCPDLAWVAPHCLPGQWRPNHRIRMGIVSHYLNGHTIGKFNRGLIARLDRDAFHVTVFQVGAIAPDEVSDHIADTADRYLQISGTLEAMRQAIAQEELDVLLYTDIGMHPMSYFLAFARLAPVQCVTWGHPVTTGISNLDYFLTSGDLESDNAQDYYSERLVRTRTLYPYYYPTPVPNDLPGRADLGLPADAKLYVFAQSLFKLHPDFDAVIRYILARDPLGQFVFVEGGSTTWRDLLLRRLQENGIDTDRRVLFLPPLTTKGFLGLLKVADALLDSCHFSGGNTTYDACAVGVPVVTWPSERMPSRITYAMYRQLDVLDTVAHDADEYVAIAVRLANDADWRSDIQRRIVANLPRLFHVDTGVREVESFLVSAVASARKGVRLPESVFFGAP